MICPPSTALRVLPVYHRFWCALLFAALLTGAVAQPAPSPPQTAGVPAGGALDSKTHQPPQQTLTTVSLKIKLPFPAGATYEVIQGNHGAFTHSGFNRYAWDFGMPENSPVCAAASGRVVRVKQDGHKGGPSNEYFGQGNTIILDHGNGYFTQYLHLAQNSAKVAEGDLVAGGQIIGLSGNTGFSNTPHLHFQVQDATGRSLPALFQDVKKGVPVEDSFVTSANDGSQLHQYAGESWLPPDAFLRNSIALLTRNLPGHLYRRGRDYPVRGRLLDKKAKRVAIYIMAANGGKPLKTIYADVDRHGFFQATLRLDQISPHNWSESTAQSNMFSLAIASVNDDGSFWSEVSVPVCIR